MSWKGANEHGVYSNVPAEEIRFEVDWRTWAAIYVLEIEPGKWAFGYSYNYSIGGGGGPITEHRTFSTRDEAVERGLDVIGRDQGEDSGDWPKVQEKIRQYRNQGRLF